MVRLTDILGEGGQIPEPHEDKKKEKSAPSEAEKETQLVKAMHQLQLTPEEAQRIYTHTQDLIKEILNNVESDNTIDLTKAYEVIKDLVDHFILGDKELISLTVNYSKDNYLYAHLVNVCILSLDVGLGLGYNKSKLNELGLGAFLYDVGMVKVMALAKQPRRLNKQEFEEIKKHPNYGSHILSKIEDIPEVVIFIAKQHHERLNGQGYPEGLRSEQLNEYAKIVAVVDVYEALTHPRSYRKAFSPHEAIRELLAINFSTLFETSILKVLINRIGLYPMGSWVELNTGEVGKVISSNEKSPLRPQVNVIFGTHKQRLAETKLIDLFQHTNIFIKRSINPQELNLEL